MQRFVFALKRHPAEAALAGVLVLLLLLKFLLPLFRYGIPLGYDVGIYRYLFIRHAEGFPPFAIADIEPWARNHPLGLFIFTSPLIKLGMPVDWLLGWIWNLVPVALLVLLAVVTARREGMRVGALVLLAGLLSAPYFDGFSGMYWKTYAALFFMVLTYAAFDRRSWWAMVPAVLTVITHHQTGFLLLISVGAWWILSIKDVWKSRAVQRATFAGIGALVLALLFYIPIWRESILDNLQLLITRLGTEGNAGSFPPPLFYIRTNGLLLAAGAYGFVMSARKKGSIATPWYLTVLCAALYILLRLFFYRRFFLQFDFFLLPFAALGMDMLWARYAALLQRLLFLVLIVTQGMVSYQVMGERFPDIDRETLALVQNLEGHIPEGATVLTLENLSTGWVLGWLPHNEVAGPGLFAVPWKRQQWEQLLYGTHEERKELLSSLQRPLVYIVLSPLFYAHYQEYAAAFLKDPCFEKIEGQPLLKVVC